jgi:hypothetical protein
MTPMNNAIPAQPTKAQVVAFEVLLGEREYQGKTHGDSPVPTIINFADLLLEYTDKLAEDVMVDPTGMSASPAGGPLKRFREIAAIALHAMEIHGIQPRENHVPASAGITGTVNIVGKADSIAPAKPAAAPAAPAAAPAAASTHFERTAPPPPPQTDAPPRPEAQIAAPVVTTLHEAAPLPHHPASGEHGKK